MSKVCLLVISRREVSGAGKTEDGLVQYNEEVNRLEDDLRELYETIRVNVDEEEQWKVFDFVEDFFMEELEIGDYINDINSYHLHMFDKHDVTTKKLDAIVEMQVEKWVNLEDVAEHLSISQDTVRTWIKEGKLPVYRAGKRYKFKISEVDEWVRKGKIQE